MLKYFLNTFDPMQTPLNSSEIPERALGQVSKKNENTSSTKEM